MPRTTDTRKARRTRVERARVLAELEGGKLDIRALLDAPPTSLLGADLWDVLLRVPNLGRRGIQTLCERSGVWVHCKLEDLKYYEVERLKDSLPQRVD